MSYPKICRFDGEFVKYRGDDKRYIDCTNCMYKGTPNCENYDPEKEVYKIKRTNK